MNAGEFARRRDRILYESEHRSSAWRRRAMYRLIVDAGAVLIDRDRFVLINGQRICAKQRYISQQSAEDALESISRVVGSWQKKPIRAYECGECRGWHLTSKPSQFENIFPNVNSSEL